MPGPSARLWVATSSQCVERSGFESIPKPKDCHLPGLGGKN
jgi:hypothetical protein